MGLKRVRTRRDDALARSGWQSLEAVLAVYYRRQGYAVEHVGTGGTGARFDGGVDLELRRGAEHVLVQAKHWNACQVPHNAVHELLGVMVNQGATGAILVTSGEFTRAAVEAATRHGHVQLVDSDALRRMLADLPDDAMPTPDPAAAFADALGTREASRPRRAGPTRRPAARSNAAWIGLAVVGALVFVLLIRGVLHRTQWTAGRAPTASAANPSSEHAAEPVADDGPVAPQVYEARPVDATRDACAAETARGDGCGGAPLSAAELREQQRRADEAMRVIVATTPEMQ